MGRELVERAGLGPRASVSAAVARTGPQARASWSSDTPHQKTEAELPKAARGRNSANSVHVKFKSALLVHVAACEPNWATAIYAPLGQRTRGGDGESSNPSAKYYHYIHILGLPETFIY